MRNSLMQYCRPAGLEGVELLHCADPDFRSDPHVHDAYVFWFNGEGGERVSLGGTTDILRPDSFGVVAPGEVHANHAVTAQRTLNSLYVAESVVEDVARQMGGRATCFRSRLQRDPLSRRALARLHCDLTGERDAFLAQETFLRVMGVLLERHGEFMPAASERRDPVIVGRCLAAMRERFGEQLDLESLAEACRCTPSHLVRLFRREVGITPHAYLMELRLAHARTRLAGFGPIGDIALECGFTDQSHLTRRFRARFWLTPGEYRRQVGGR